MSLVQKITTASLRNYSIKQCNSKIWKCELAFLNRSAGLLNLNNGNNFQVLLQRRHFLKAVTTKVLSGIESAANSKAHDADAQVMFLELLRHTSPQAVISRVEQKKFAVNDAVAKIYLQALADAGKLTSKSTEEILSVLQVPSSKGHSTQDSSVAGSSQQQGESMASHIKEYLAKSVSSGGLNVGKASIPATAVKAQPEANWSSFAASLSSSDPLHVKMHAPSWKSEMWHTFRDLGLTLLLVSAIGAVLDDREGGITSRIMGGNKFMNIVETSDKKFEDVCGVDEAKAELQEIVLYLKDPKRFTRLGGRLPKGMLLVGPPGTGKTLLARAIAGEAGVPFFYCSGSEFEEMFVGVGARRVRDLFDMAKKKSPCIIFIDEIDAIGGSRHLKEQQAMKMTLNQLLVEMDGFKQNNGVIVIAATNFPEVLDSALMRPGRFDRHIQVPLPDVGGRKQIIDYYSKAVKLDPKADLSILARGTPGMSGADLNNLINQAALKASADGLTMVTQACLDYAKDKILMGAERKSAVISPETARNTAYHEGGHALVALKTEGADPLHKATIMPRGQSLGMTVQLPEGDQKSRSYKEMLASLDVLMGGRVAEELIFGEQEVTSGASSDIQQATRLASQMVMFYGMSDSLGPVFHKELDELSPSTKDEIDRQVRQLVDRAYQRAKKLLTENRGELDKLAGALIEYETLSGEEIQEILSGKKLNRASTNRHILLKAGQKHALPNEYAKV